MAAGERNTNILSSYEPLPGQQRSGWPAVSVSPWVSRPVGHGGLSPTSADLRSPATRLRPDLQDPPRAALYTINLLTQPVLPSKAAKPSRPQLKEVQMDVAMLPDDPYGTPSKRRPRVYAHGSQRMQQRPASHSPAYAMSPPTTTFTTVSADALVPLHVDPKKFEYRAVGLKQAYGERPLCHRVPTSPGHSGRIGSFTAARDASGAAKPQTICTRPSKSGDSRSTSWVAPTSAAASELVHGRPEPDPSESVELMRFRTTEGQDLTFDNWREGQREGAWTGKVWHSLRNEEPCKRGWLYVHKSKVHSLHYANWKGMFIVLESGNLVFYRETVVGHDLEGNKVSMCLGKADCYTIEAARLDPPCVWPYGIQITTMTGTIRLASATERERDAWLEALSHHFGLDTVPISPLSPVYYEREDLSMSDECATASAFSSSSPKRRQITMEKRNLTSGQIVRNQARDFLSTEQQKFSLQSAVKTAGKMRKVEDFIQAEGFIVRKSLQRHKTALPAHPVSRWSEEGLNRKKEQWLHAANDQLWLPGDREITATGALEQGIPTARRAVVISALSKSAAMDDALNVRSRKVICGSMQEELESIHSQVQSIHEEIDADGSEDSDFIMSMRFGPVDDSQTLANGRSGNETPNTASTPLDAEDRMCRDLVSLFPKRWLEKASREVDAQFGISSWVKMSHAQKLAAIYTAMNDANDIGQILKDVPASDPTKNVLMVNYRTIPTMVSELVILATRMGDRGKALACLESIFDDDVRAETTNKVHELAVKMWMDDLVAELIKRGHTKEGLKVKRAGTPANPSRTTVLPGTASDLLRSYIERKEHDRLKGAIRPATPPPVVDMAAHDAEADDSSDEEPDLLGPSRPVTAAAEIDEEDQSEAKEFCQVVDVRQVHTDSDVASKENEVVDEAKAHARPSWEDADEDSLKYVMEIKELRIFNATQEIINIIALKYGHTLTEDFVEDLKEYFEIEDVMADLPEEHPVRVNMMRLAGMLGKLTFSAWRNFSRVCTKHKKELREQYMIACKHRRGLPVALQTVSRFINDKGAASLDVSGHGLTGTAASSFLEAITAHGGWCPDGALDLNFVRKRLGYHPLTLLDLSENDLRDNGAIALATHLLLPKCSWSLTTLKVSANRLRDEGCLALVPLVNTDRFQLKHLSVGKNQIGDKAMEKLIKEVSANRFLISLDISENKAGDKSGQAIGGMLRENSTLTTFNCSNNQLRGLGACAVAEGLLLNDTLVDVDLSWNGFGDEAPCGVVAKLLGKAESLLKLNLAHTRIDFRGAIALATQLENNSTIKELVMDDNSIGMTGVQVMMKAAKKAGANQDFPLHVSLIRCEAGGGTKSIFDPSQPAGNYELDMSDGFSGGILKNLLRLHAMGRGFFVALDQTRVIDMAQLMVQARPPANATLVIGNGIPQRYTIMLPSEAGEDDDGNPCRVVDPDETNWEIPTEGLLKFKFAMILVRDKESNCLDESASKNLQSCFQNRKKNSEDREEAMDLYIGPETVLTFQNVIDLVSYLQGSPDDMELANSRGTLIAKCYHKLDQSHRAPDLLDLLDRDARNTAEKILGVVSSSFTRNNPTGRYKLNLKDKAEREVCMRLIECRSEQSKRLAQLEAYYKSRTGRRDPIERTWRNCTFDKKPFDFDMSWKVPEKGVIEFDFVHLKKPTCEDKPLTDEEFFSYCKKHLEPFIHAGEEARYVGSVRRWSDRVVFTCKQLRRLLRRLKTPLARVEIIVIGFARTVDWHSFKYIQHEVSVNEFKELRQRIGLVNMWDESMACDYYELDLEDPEQRWVCQEVLHLGSIEPGENMGESMLDGIDFTITSAWLQPDGVPRRGLLQIYYNREARIIRQISEKGAWDHENSPFHKDGFLRGDGSVLFPKTSFHLDGQPVFMPTWLIKFAKDEDGALHEPPGAGWIREHKLRRIVNKLKERFPNAEAAMTALDKDGGGDLDRKEIARGLFEMGIFLHPDETKALFEAIDEDDGGTVDMQEFTAFWHSYSENRWLDEEDHFDF